MGLMTSQRPTKKRTQINQVFRIVDNARRANHRRYRIHQVSSFIIHRLLNPHIRPLSSCPLSHRRRIRHHPILASSPVISLAAPLPQTNHWVAERTSPVAVKDRQTRVMLAIGTRPILSTVTRRRVRWRCRLRWWRRCCR